MPKQPQIPNPFEKGEILTAQQLEDLRLAVMYAIETGVIAGPGLLSQKVGGRIALSANPRRTTSTLSHPFKVTAGPGLNAACADGRVRSALFDNIVEPPVSETVFYKIDPSKLIPGVTHAMTDDRYNLIAIEAVLRWRNSLDFTKPPHGGNNRFSWTSGGVTGSALTDLQQWTLAQLTSDDYSIVTDTISTAAWEAGTPRIEPDALRNTLTLDPDDVSFVNPHIVHYPIAVVKTESGAITEIHQIVIDNLFDPWPGFVLMVEGNTFDV